VILFKRQMSRIMGVIAVALVLSAAWVAAAFGEGTATYEASIGSSGSGNGQLSHPAGVALDAEGNLWVADQGNDRIQEFNEAGEYVSQFGSYGSGNGQFVAPKGIAIDAEGNIWVADSGNGRLQQFDDEGEFIKAVGSGGSGSGQFSGPEAIAVDAEGNIWVADTYNYRIQKLDDEGEFIEVVNPEGLGAIEPTGIGIGSGGKVWVTDWAHNRVVALSEAGAFVSQFGSGGSGNGHFNHPDGIDVDSKGNLWVGDEGNSRVQRFNEKGEYLDQFGSGGSGEGEFSFSYPFGIVADSGAYLWVADANNNRVQKWSTSPVPLCHAGSASTEASEPLVLEAGALECEGEGPLTFEIVSGPEHGEISEFDPETGALTYTPDSEFTGFDSFAFKATNGLGSSAVKTFKVAVGKVAVCHDGEGATAAGEPLVLEAGALECEGEPPLEYEIVSGPEHGEISGFDSETGALTYTPESEFAGPDSFTFRAVNGLGPSPVKSFQVTVQAVPACSDGRVSTPEGELLVLEAGVLKCEGEPPLDYEIVSGPEHGEISGFNAETGALTYTPDPEFRGLDSIDFRAVNDIGPSAVKTLEIAVGDIAVCSDGEATTPMDHPLVLEAGVLKCEGEPPLDYEIVSGPEHGEISEFDPGTGAFTYTPESEFAGPDSFAFRAVNGLGPSPTQSFQVTVQGLPICHNGEAATAEGEPLSLEAGALECEGEGSLEYEIVSGPEHGEISELDPETGALTYTPAAEFNGYDSFHFRAGNGAGPSSTKTFEIEVGAITAGTPVFQFSFGSWGFSEGRFQHPTDVAVDDDGHVYVLDGTLYSVQKFTERGEFIKEFGEGGSGNGELSHPSALAVGPDGDIWVADSGNDRIERFGPEGEYVDQFGSSGGEYGGYSAYWEGHGRFRDPEGIAVDEFGNIYVSDSSNHRIQKFDEEGNFLDVHQLVGEVGPGEFVYPNPPVVAQDEPGGIAVGPNGDVWYTESANIVGSVTRLSPELDFLGEVDGSPELGHPQAIDVDSRGNVWVGDARHDRVVEFNRHGKFLNEFGKWSGFPGGNFDFGSPFGHFGLDVDAHNRIWIADENNYRVQRWVEHQGQAAVCEERDATTAVDHPLHLTAADLGCEGEAPLSFEIASEPEHGEISEFDPETGALTYEPESEYNGPDSFSFKATNALGSSEVMFLSIEVGQAPDCEVLTVSTEVEEPLPVQLDCSGDHSGDAYEIVKEPGHGEISEFDPEEGSLTYAPDSGFQGVDKFTYQRSSWVHSSKATVTIAVCAPPTVEAWGDAVDPETPGLTLRVYAAPDSYLCAGVFSLEVEIDDETVFAESRDCEKAEQGCKGMHMIRDVQLPREQALGTHDYSVKAMDEAGREVEEVLPEIEIEEEGTVLDLKKEDEAEPEEGKCRQPRLIGGVVVGSYCSEMIHPYKGAIVYRGSKGNDIMYGTGKSETLRGDGGQDTIVAGRGSDKVKAFDGDDTVFGGSGDDEIWGGGDDDVLNGGPGADKIKGENGDDLVRGGATVDKLFGGGGENTLSYADGVTPGFFIEPSSPVSVPEFPGRHGQRGVYVDLENKNPFGDDGEAARYGGGADKILDGGFTDVIGTPFADVIVGSDKANTIDAGAGTDIVRGEGGADAIYGGPNQDYLDGGTQAKENENEIKGDAEDTCINGNAPEECSTNPESAFKTPEEATAEETQVLVGVLNAHSPRAESSVYVRGSTGNDHIIATSVSENEVDLELQGGETTFESDSCTLKAAGLKAECTGSQVTSFLAFGGDGQDTIEAEQFPRTKSVTLLGGDEHDRLIGSPKSEDVLAGGADGAGDFYEGLSGDDTLFSTLGKDTLLGGLGDDLFVDSSICDGDHIRGGGGDDNANWAQLAGPEIKKENYPAKPTDPPFADLDHGVQVRLSEKAVISRQAVGCNESGEIAGGIAGVEYLEGSNGPDVLVGNGGDNILLGRGGADVLRGRGGNDAILANNRNPHRKLPTVTAAEKIDLDKRLECGAGKDSIKLDEADAKHFGRKGLKGCDLPPGKSPRTLIEKPSNYRPLADFEGEDEPGEMLDERMIGGAGTDRMSHPGALFRFDEVSGSSAVNWTSAFDLEEEEGEQEKFEEEAGESWEESEEELSDLEEEEVEEEEDEDGGPEGTEEELGQGTYEGGVTLDRDGVIEGSRAIELDGEDDYVDLSDGWDPASFVADDCGENVSGYSVEIWVKFAGEPSATEELFSRSEAGEGLFLYRSPDGRLNFSVRGGVESPTVSSEEPVDDGNWHQVVAVMAQRAEECIIISRASRAAVSAEELETLESPEMILYVDGFPYTLGVGFEQESIIPEWLENAHNIVGASVFGGGFSNWLAGSVDDVAIYGYPLNFGEVEEHLALSDAVQPTAYLEPFPDPKDTDEDGVVDSLDNCSEVSNSEQGDEDQNGVGDFCEPQEDSDEDGIIDEIDNCPDDPNPLQEDLNENKVGDVCEAVE
jgi:streptogramin lyase/Ca2+-binding RTX toxin-like protein